MINPFTVSVTEFWRYFMVASFTFLLVMYAIRWNQVAATTKAHKIIGLVVLSVMALVLLVLAIDYKRLYILLPLFFVSQGVWLGFNNWYFHNYPGLQEWLNSVNRKLGTFGLDTWLGRALTERADPVEPKPVTRESLSTWRTVGITMSVLFVFALGFGFARQMNLLALYTHQSTIATKQAARSTKQAVDTAVKQTAVALTTQITSLSQGQQQLAQQVKSGNQTLTSLVGANGKKAEVASQAATKAAKAAAVAAKRSAPFIFVTPQPITTIPPPSIDPGRVKPVQPKTDNKPRRLNRQVRWRLDEDEPVDSTIFVHNTSFND